MFRLPANERSAFQRDERRSLSTNRQRWPTHTAAPEPIKWKSCTSPYHSVPSASSKTRCRSTLKIPLWLRDKAKHEKNMELFIIKLDWFPDSQTRSSRFSWPIPNPVMQIVPPALSSLKTVAADVCTSHALYSTTKRRIPLDKIPTATFAH